MSTRLQGVPPWPDGVPALTRDCPACGGPLWAASMTRRAVTTLEGTIRLTLTIRRCHNLECPRFLRPYRPEAEPHFALPYHEFGLDVMATVGRLRHAEHRRIPEIHQELIRRSRPASESDRASNSS